MSDRGGLWGRSLRTQLVILGLGAVVLPLLLLLGVVAVTASSQESVVEMAPPTGEEPLTGFESETGVPVAVVITALGLIVVGAAAVWIWAGRAVAPMYSITQVANEIQAGSLDRRIGDRGGPAEVQALGHSFDAMLDRLQRSSSTQRQLVEDASHELRTPLAALAVNNEVILEHPQPTTADYRAAAERNEALIERLQVTIDDLLTGARTRNQEAQQVDNDLMAIAARVVDQHRTLNPDVPITLLGPDTLRLGIDGPSVQRALANLVENAARYSPPDRPVEVAVVGGGRPAVSVTDHGPGIAPEDQAHVFERYYRADQEPATGSGIGLALVKQVADAHGAIAITSPLPGTDHGTRFTISFVS